MGYNLNNKVNSNGYSEYICINEEDSHLKITLNKLRKEKEELSIKMLKATTRAMMEGKPVVTEVCNAVNKHYATDGWIDFSNNKSEGVMDNFVLEKEYINSIKINDDFFEAYVLEEDINTVWIVIEQSTFEFNKKYLKSAREFKENNNCNFNLIIFEKDEIDEIKEQLKYVGYYEVINK